jgi:hypothetical protein
MVEVKKPKLTLVPGEQAGKMRGAATKAHGDVATRCMLDIYAIRDRMAGRTADPELFKKEFDKYFNPPTTKSDLERKRQMEVARDKWLKFEDEFNARLGADGYRSIPLPAEKIATTVKHIADTAWQGFRPIREGWNQHPPDSA